MKLVDDSNRQKYIDFIQKHPKGHFLQSPEWAKLKNTWKNEVLLVEDKDGNIKGAMSILIREMPYIKSTMMYAPRGPVCDVHDKETIKELTEGAKELAKKYNSFILRIDPDVPNDDDEFKKIVKECGFKIKENVKDFTEVIQPRYVFRLDVKDKTEEELMKSFHEKTRYNIRLSGRKGVTLRDGTKEDLKDFHRIMKETGTRDDFLIRPLEYFEEMYDALGSEYLRLIMAEYEGKPIAGVVAIYYGNKVWYLYGACSNSHRNVMQNYLLQWEMIKWALEKKCDVYDFRGVSGHVDENHPQYGIYKFKKGFNGDFVEFVGELYMVFKPMTNLAFEKAMTMRTRMLGRQVRKEKAKEESKK